MRKLDFKFKIFIYFAIAAIIPSLLFWIFIYAKLDDKLQEDYKDATYNTIQTYIREVDHFFEHQAQVAESLAHAYPEINNSPRDLSRFLQEQAAINEDFLNLYIIKTNGQLITDKKEISKLENFKSYIPYDKASRLQKLVWLETYKDHVSGLNAIGVAIPLYNNNRVFDGVLVANLKYDYFQKVISSTTVLAESEIFLVNNGGDIKYAIGQTGDQSKSIKEGSFILQHVSKEILSKKQGFHDVTYDGGRWLCTFSETPTTGWKVIVLYDYNKIIGHANIINKDIYSFITYFGVALLILIIILSIVISNSISKPLSVLRDGVQKFALGDLDTTISIKGMSEIKMVAETFNQMAYNLKKSYSDLFKRTDELYQNNEYLQEINAELEASYEQLSATTEQLNESEEKYRKLVNNISDMVVVLNTEAEIVYVNSSVESVIGYPESQLIGRSLRDVLKGAFNEAAIEDSFVNDNHEFQIKMQKADGSIVYLEGSTRRLVEQGNVVGVQAIARDITQRKHMEDELQTRYKELQAINEVSNAVTRTLDMQELTEIVVEQVLDATGALCCTVGLHEGEEKGYVLKAVKGKRLEDSSIVSVDSTKKQTLKLIGNNRYFVLEQKGEEMLPNPYFKLLYREEGARFTLFTPLIAHGEQIGLMSTILRDKPSQELIDLVISMGNSIALSIDNAKAYANVKESYLKTVQSLVSAIEAKDMYTESHSLRVAKYAAFIASELEMEKNDIQDIWVAGVLHDIGKIGISDSILNKNDRLTNEEYQIVKQHPEIAYKILSNIGLDHTIMKAIRHHHERFDGKGYPEGLNGESINMMASVISVADAFDAITSERSYKKPKTLQEGIEELVACKGSQFHPQVVDAFYHSFHSKQDTFFKIHNDEEVKFF